MRKLLTAVMLLSAPTAFAQVIDTEKAEEEFKEDAQQIENVARGGSEQERQQQKVKEQALFEKSGDAFKVEGTVTKVDDDEITLSRQELPDVKLDVERQTKIELDGQQITAEQLKERVKAGDQVEARFQLNGDDPVAVELKAEKSQGVGGSGK